MNPFVTVSCYAAASTVLLLAVMLSSPGDVQGLTAFGKSNTPDPKSEKPNTPKQERGRECKTNADCAGIGTTSCILGKADGKKRCLCKDLSPSINGKCILAKVAPGRGCQEDSECIENAECALQNKTMKKVCACREGFAEEPFDDNTNICSGACASVFPSVVALVILSVTVLFVDPRTANERV